MRWSLIVATVLLAASVLSLQRASAKGAVAGTFLISGGDLPHPVTVSLAETSLAIDGLGAWYEEVDPATAPRADAVTYRIQLVDPQHPNDGPLIEDMSYVPGSEPFVRASGMAGWSRLAKPLASLFDRYITLTRGGKLSERPGFADAVRASAERFPTTVSVGGVALPADQLPAFLSLIGQIQPVYFGVQGRLLGQRGLREVPLRISFGPYDLDLAYVPAGPVAPFALLLDTKLLGSWDYIAILDPPGYAQIAYSVPTGLERLMVDLGYSGADLQDVIHPHTVPLLEVQREFAIDRIEVSRAAAVLAALHLGADGDVCSSAGATTLSAPAGTATLTVSVWPAGFEPFPNAVQPSVYDYYAPASAGDQGVLVETQQMALYNGSYGPLSSPCYAAPAFDRQLRAIAGGGDTASQRRVFIIVAGAAAAWLLVLGALGLFVSSRSRSAR